MLLLKLLLCSPSGLHTRLTLFSACRIKDSFVSLTALTQQRRSLIVRLFGLSLLKALQAYTPLTLFCSCGYLASVRNVSPVTHRLDYPTSLLLCFALWASSSRTPTGFTSAYALNTPMRLNLLYLSSFSCWGVIFLYSSIALRISFLSSSPIAS